MQNLDVNFLSRESGVFVTGTDTGIGKTYASCAVIRALAASGRRVQGMKPVASGCEWIHGQWQNEDALALRAAAASTADYALVNPFALPLATAPQIAAHEAGVNLALPVMQAAYTKLNQAADVVLVEGVGGWLAPLSDTMDQSMLVKALEIPVVLVVGMRLGCISHARLSERVIAADGCRLLGWVANAVDPEFDQDGRYFQALAAVMQSPCLGRIGYNG
jgi:dethiobiotin synthetase